LSAAAAAAAAAEIDEIGRPVAVSHLQKCQFVGTDAVTPTSSSFLKFFYDYGKCSLQSHNS